MRNKFIIAALIIVVWPHIIFAQGVLDLGEINILASRSNLMASEINKGLSLITAEDIQESTATSIAEIINIRSGLIVNNQLGNPKGVSVDVRGFGETASANVLVLVDGRRTNQADLSGVDWAQISVDSVDRIEILRGPSTVLYGDNASAGVVNIITKKGYRSSDAPMMLRTEFGSFGHQKQGISVGSTFKKIDYFVNYSHEQTSGYRENNDYWANDYFANISWAASEKLNLKFSSGYHRDRYGMPGALFRSELKTLGRKATTHPDDRGWTSDAFVNVEPEITFDFNAQDIKFSFFHAYRKRYAKSLFVSPWGRYETAHRIDSFEAQPKLKIESLVDVNIQNTLTTGVDFFYAKNHVRSGDQAAEQDATDIVKQTVSFYVLERVKLFERFMIYAGARGVWADYRFHQKAVLKNKETRRPTESALSFGLGYQYQKDSQVYFDYSRSFRLPATDEYYQNKWENFWGSGGGLNMDLKHQTGHNFQWGIRDVSLPYLKTDISAFLMDTKDEIYFDPITFENSNYLGQTRRWGFELEGRADLLKSFFQPYVNWTWQDAFFKGGTYAGHQVPFVPRNKISAGIIAPVFKNLQTTFSMQWVDQRFVISDQSNVQPKLNSIVTFDFKMDYQWKSIHAWFGIKNMFDRMYHAYGVYSAFADDTGYYPAPGRQFVSGFRLDF